MENWKRLRAPGRPYFLRSTARASRVTKPAREGTKEAGREVGHAAAKGGRAIGGAAKDAGHSVKQAVKGKGGEGAPKADD